MNNACYEQAVANALQFGTLPGSSARTCLGLLSRTFLFSLGLDCAFCVCVGGWRGELFVFPFRALCGLFWWDCALLCIEYHI